jgi:cell division septum initiation protein DivIVA
LPDRPQEKANGGANPKEIVAALAATNVRTLVKSQPGVFALLKAHAVVIALLAGFGAQLLLTGRWAGQIEKGQDASAQQISELKATLAGMVEDARRTNEARIEDARQTSYTRAQLEVVGKQLASIEATLRERR